MNINICKKCLKKQYAQGYGETKFKGALKRCEIIYGRGGINRLMLTYGKISSDNTIFCVMRVNKPKDRKKNFFERVEMEDKNCPYFVEHQLFDWNK